MGRKAKSSKHHGNGRRKRASRAIRNNDHTPSIVEYNTISARLATNHQRIMRVGADGNCLFRSLSDQLTGTPEHHHHIRAAVISYMKSHSSDFAPFIDDSQTYSEYLTAMAGDGIWGDHLELQAASSLFHVHIAVHQIGGIVRIENSHITSREYSDAIKRARTLWHHRIHTSTTSSSLTPSTSQVSESKTMSDTKRSDPDDMKSSTASSASSGPASSDDAILSPLLRAAATRAFARVLHVSYHRRQHYNRMMRAWHSVRSVDDLDDGDASAMNWLGPIQFQLTTCQKISSPSYWHHQLRTRTSLILATTRQYMNDTHILLYGNTADRRTMIRRRCPRLITTWCCPVKRSPAAVAAAAAMNASSAATGATSNGSSKRKTR